MAAIQKARDILICLQNTLALLVASFLEKDYNLL